MSASAKSVVIYDRLIVPEFRAELERRVSGCEKWAADRGITVEAVRVDHADAHLDDIDLNVAAKRSELHGAVALCKEMGAALLIPAPGRLSRHTGALRETLDHMPDVTVWCADGSVLRRDTTRYGVLSVVIPPGVADGMVPLGP